MLPVNHIERTGLQSIIGGLMLTRNNGWPIALLRSDMIQKLPQSDGSRTAVVGNLS
jgi:hypothetical protein